MPYLTQQDLEDYFGTRRILQLADEDHDGVIDAAIITEVLARTDGEINRHLAPNYTIATLAAAMPDTVRDIAFNIAIYKLHQRHPEFDAREYVRKDYEDAVKYLKEVREGKQRIDANGTPETPDNVGGGVGTANTTTGRPADVVGACRWDLINFGFLSASPSKSIGATFSARLRFTLARWYLRATLR